MEQDFLQPRESDARVPAEMQMGPLDADAVCHNGACIQHSRVLPFASAGHQDALFCAEPRLETKPISHPKVEVGLIRLTHGDYASNHRSDRQFSYLHAEVPAGMCQPCAMLNEWPKDQRLLLLARELVPRVQRQGSPRIRATVTHCSSAQARRSRRSRCTWRCLVVTRETASSPSGPQ